MDETNNIPQENREKKNNNYKLFLTIFIILLMFLIGYIVYDQVINKKDNNDQNSSSASSSSSSEIDEIKNNLDLNNPLVKNLIYPVYNDGFNNYISSGWNYSNVSLETMDRNDKMRSALYSPLLNNVIGNDIEGYENYKVSDFIVQKNFIKFFGPDAEYINGSFKGVCDDTIYNSSTKEYSYAYECGPGDGPYFINNLSRIYKAEIEDDNIYVYHYYTYYLESYDEINRITVYYFDHYPIINVDFTYNDNVSAPKALMQSEDIDNGFNLLINEGKAKTYKYTFKKQSDGNHYFYSAEIQ